ncbi:DUF3560 domain-containing protein [Streptomyces sp. 8N706]|uniref:DUF3560 domain-containing protein n=1 Tax=Streptomyces sp. 8N706 TaxID=3457416 RepID=UPI003FD55D8E
MTTIKITHTRSDGTLVHGTVRGDGSAAILKQRAYGPHMALAFRWSRHLGCWFLPHSRDKEASRRSIDALAEQLRTAGFTVTTEVNEDERRSFADAEADRTERAQGRAERFDGYADRAAQNADALSEKARSMAGRIPFGQPILVGHHSEQRDRNYRERIHRTQGKAIAEGDRAEHWSRRQEAAANWERFRKNPGTTLRRIARLEADERMWLRVLDGDTSKGWHVVAPEQRAEVERRLEEVREQLAYWREVVAEAERNGFKVWSRADFTKGDYVRYGNRWYQVLRVNPKTVTVPSILNVHQAVVTRENSTFGDMTHTLPYDKISGRRSAEEMTEKLPQQPETH